MPDMAALHRALDHAGRVLADLAHAHNDIADALIALASCDGSALAAERWRLAEQASAAARRAHDRVYALHRLAKTNAAQARP
jgi:hypothetical protein